jgi:integrase
VLTPIESKLPHVGTTIFTVMSRLAAECGAINLSQGFPDFDPPPRLVELVAEAMRSGVNQYAPMAGAPPLLEAIAAEGNLQLRVFLTLALVTGARRGELSGMKWEDLDGQRSTWRIRRSLAYIPGKPLAEKAPKTDAPKYGIAELAEALELSPASTRVKLRSAKIQKTGGRYGWNTKAEMNEVVDKIKSKEKPE